MVSLFLSVTHTPAYQIGSLALAGVLYFGGMVRLWPKWGWFSRLSYGFGGIVLAYYEFHMQWVWLALGLAAIVSAWQWPERSADRREEHSSESTENL